MVRARRLAKIRPHPKKAPNTVVAVAQSAVVVTANVTALIGPAGSAVAVAIATVRVVIATATKAVARRAPSRVANPAATADPITNRVTSVPRDVATRVNATTTAAITAAITVAITVVITVVITVAITVVSNAPKDVGHGRRNPVAQSVTIAHDRTVVVR